LSGKDKKDAKMKEEDVLPEDEFAVADEAVEDELEAALREVAEMKDKMLRMHAEMDNMRKRTQRDVADAHKFGIEKFAVALLDVVDNLERALNVDEGNEKGLRDGVQLTLDSWHEMMQKFHMKRIDAVGEPFDPHYHEALSQMPHEEPEGTVVAQHVAGYTLHDRLIRPAKVLVSTGSGS